MTGNNQHSRRHFVSGFPTPAPTPASSGRKPSELVDNNELEFILGGHSNGLGGFNGQYDTTLHGAAGLGRNLATGLVGYGAGGHQQPQVASRARATHAPSYGSTVAHHQNNWAPESHGSLQIPTDWQNYGFTSGIASTSLDQGPLSYRVLNDSSTIASGIGHGFGSQDFGSLYSSLRVDGIAGDGNRQDEAALDRNRRGSVISCSSACASSNCDQVDCCSNEECEEEPECEDPSCNMVETQCPMETVTCADAKAAATLASIPIQEAEAPQRLQSGFVPPLQNGFPQGAMVHNDALMAHCENDHKPQWVLQHVLEAHGSDNLVPCIRPCIVDAPGVFPWCPVNCLNHPQVPEVSDILSMENNNYHFNLEHHHHQPPSFDASSLPDFCSSPQEGCPNFQYPDMLIAHINSQHRPCHELHPHNSHSHQYQPQFLHFPQPMDSFDSQTGGLVPLADSTSSASQIPRPLDQGRSHFLSEPSPATSYQASSHQAFSTTTSSDSNSILTSALDDSTAMPITNGVGDDIDMSSNSGQSSLLPSLTTPGQETETKIIIHQCLWHENNVFCGQIFGTAKELNGHVISTHIKHLHKTESGFHCHWKDCKRKTESKTGFPQKSKIERHIQTHTGEKPFLCTECGSSFSAKQALDQHILIHSDEKPLVCPFEGCGKRFRQQSARTMHMRTHNGEKPLQCKVCGRSFSESSNLSKHRRTHLGQGKFACEHPGCKKTFHRADQLRRHKKVHEQGRGGSKSPPDDSLRSPSLGASPTEEAPMDFKDFNDFASAAQPLWNQQGADHSRSDSFDSQDSTLNSISEEHEMKLVPVGRA